MTLVLISLDASCEPQPAPVACPYCRRADIYSWGLRQKQVNDTVSLAVAVQRWYCKNCQRTFRVYPAGIDRSHTTQRVRRLAALAWLLGLSLREVTQVFAVQGVTLNRMTIWRESQKLVDEFNCLGHHFALGRRLWIDPGYGRWGERGADRPRQAAERIELALQLRTGQATLLGWLNTNDAPAAICWLAQVMDHLDIPVSVSLYSQPIL